MVQLIRPSLKYKRSFIEAVKESHAEGRGLHLNVLELEKDFDTFLLGLENQEKGIGLLEGYVPASTFWLVDDDGFAGRVSIRHRLTDDLLQMGGHIGYEIRPSKRRMGYGTKGLELVLPLAKSLEISKVLVTCDDDNVGSWKIIEKNGGILENKITHEGKLKRRYWIII
jgi:predicted acetyltransferase